MRKLTIILVFTLFVVGVFRVPLLKAVTASYNSTVRIVDSAGNVINGTASAVTAAYNSTVQVVDSTGHVIDSFGGAPSGPAGGDLSGTYPNPQVVNLSNVTNASLANSGLATPPCANPLNAGDLLVGVTNSNTCPTNIASSGSSAGQVLFAGGSGVAPSFAAYQYSTAGTITGGGSASNIGFLFFTPAAMHLTRWIVSAATPPATCTTYPIFEIADCGTSAPSTSTHCAGAVSMATSQSANATSYIDSGAISVSIAASHYVEIFTSTIQNTCTTNIAGVNFQENWTIP